MSKFTDEELDEEIMTQSGETITRRSIIRGKLEAQALKKDEARRELAPELLKVMVAQAVPLREMHDFPQAAAVLADSLLGFMDQFRRADLLEIEDKIS